MRGGLRSSLVKSIPMEALLEDGGVRAVLGHPGDPGPPHGMLLAGRVREGLERAAGHRAKGWENAVWCGGSLKHGGAAQTQRP